MKVEFASGDDGRAEAESVFRLVHRLPASPTSNDVTAGLEQSALEHLGDEEAQRLRQLLAHPPLLVRLRAFKYRFFGPSKYEMELGRQRSDALERADRAEKASFEALADMAERERERDVALQEIASLKSELEALRRDAAR